MGDRRYDVKDVCTNCWHDNCDTCRGGNCACRKYNHPPGHATTYIDSEGEERCECGKWLEPPYYEHDDHLRSIERKQANSSAKGVAE